MAQSYNIPGQNLTFSIPEENEVFRGVGDFGGNLYKRVGSQILNLDTVKAIIPEADRAKYGSYGGQAGYARDQLGKQYGINWNSLQQYNLGDVSTAFQRIGNTSNPFAQSTDINSFFPTPVTQTNSQYTQGANPTNSQGYTISKDGQQTYQSPSLAENLGRALASNGGGANPTQLASLMAYQQGNPGTPYPQQLLQSLGLVPQDGTQTQAQMNSGATGGQGGSAPMPPPTPMNAGGAPTTVGSNFASGAMGAPSTQNDIVGKMWQQYLQYQKDFTSGMAKSQEELNAEQQYDSAVQEGDLLNAKTSAAEAGIYDETIPTPLIGGQLSALRKESAVRQEIIAQKVKPLETKLKRLQEGRTSKMEALKAQLGFGEKALDIAMEMQKMSKPDVLGTKVNEETGDVYSFMQNADGSVSTQKIGNVGAKEVGKSKDIETTARFASGGKEQLFIQYKDGTSETKTLGSVEPSKAAGQPELRQVDGVGLVSVTPDGGYKVVVPEGGTQQTTYSNENQARNDYNTEVSQLATLLKAGQASLPEATIAEFKKTYGKYISEQEIRGTLSNIYGIKSSSTTNTSTNKPLSYAAPSSGNSTPAYFSSDPIQNNFQSGTYKFLFGL